MDTWQKYLAEHRGRQAAWDRDQAIWVAEQDAIDQRCQATGFTGTTFDRSTGGDYAAWLCGHRLGWAKSPSAAEDLIREQVEREIDHRTIPT